MGNPLTRRSVLRGGLSLGAGIGAGLALSGCGDGPDLPPPALNADVVLPEYIPYQGVDVPLPGTPEGVLSGYEHYPATPETAFPDGLPARGDGVSFMTLIFNPVPPPLDRNSYWRALNASLGTELSFEIVAVGDYPNKFAVVQAGGDLPDAMAVVPQISQRPAMFHALFQDLSEHLSGSAVRDYPYLANFPTQAWRHTVYNGGVYGIPMPRPAAGSAMLYRTDLIEERGVDPNPGSFEEFRRLCNDLTDPDQHRYAVGDPLTTLYFVLEMLGGPNKWREENGRFTWWMEDETFEPALEAMRVLVEDGVVHPDGFNVLGRFKDWFGSGQIAVNYDGVAGWNDYYRTYSQGNEDFGLGAMIAPGYDGGPGSHWSGVSSFGVLVLKKAPKDRIRHLLRVCNALAAPFGTDAYLLRKFGEPGTHHDLQGSDPILTDAGRLQTTLPTSFITDAPLALYFPERPDVVHTQHEFHRRAVDVLVRNPAEGLYSDLDVTRGATLEARLIDEFKAITRGNGSVSSWGGKMAEWRREAGDRIRAEYEESWESFQ
ncbi:extracellular solute-binding protein [Streptomyces sp. SBT349]|uniref:extracellular solute-binding protein n=1 Tax=Streptomyces sp. SBT349 TaxID=1580539 RepID=UPI00066CEE94|nr:extracellular solute-binding protein [Streptomyces sp. SBT349]